MDPMDPASREAPRPIAISALLVEDDVTVATTTREFLEHRGIATTWVPNGGDALREVGRRTFDVIVLDLTLPGRDWSSARLLRERSSSGRDGGSPRSLRARVQS
jgi:DNA-binding response OmpR family regulator